MPQIILWKTITISFYDGSEMMNIAIITGASSGIGKEFARQMDSIFSNIDEQKVRDAVLSWHNEERYNV